MLNEKIELFSYKITRTSHYRYSSVGDLREIETPYIHIAT